jgi:hypothetical protein
MNRVASPEFDSDKAGRPGAHDLALGKLPADATLLGGGIAGVVTMTVRYTAPYDCVLQEGLFDEVGVAYGGSVVRVAQTECRRRGAAACVFEIEYR